MVLQKVTAIVSDRVFHFRGYCYSADLVSTVSSDVVCGSVVSEVVIGWCVSSGGGSVSTKWGGEREFQIAVGEGRKKAGIQSVSEGT